jgi:hypothetical protein
VKVRQTIKRIRRKQAAFLEEIKAALPYFFKLKSERSERMESKRYAKSLDDNTIKTLRKHYRGKTKAWKIALNPSQSFIFVDDPLNPSEIEVAGRKSAGKTGSTPEWNGLFSCSMVPQETKDLKSEEVIINYKLPPQPVIINFSGPRK